MRPIYWPICVIRSHTVAEQLTRSTKRSPYSTPKSPSIGEIQPIIGAHSIITAQGEEWKSLRRTFNAGFAPHHLITLLPEILDQTEKFLGIMDEFASSGKEFQLSTLTTNLTFDIIGTIVMD